MDKENTDSLKRARDYAFLLLKFRLRSEKEIYQRLKRKKFTEEAIKQTLLFLKDKGFLDDEVFTRVWIQSRIRRPLGLRRIKQELKIKGVSSDIIDSQIEETKKNYREEDIVREVAQQRMGQLKGVEPESARRRLYAYLLRRGFSPETVMDTLRQLCKHTS